MKVIDLFELLIHDEPMPKNIKYFRTILSWDKDSKDYFGEQYGYFFEYLCADCGDMLEVLETEVEIIEEDKKIKKIDMFDYFTGYDFDGTSKDLLKHLERNFEIANEKLNEIIDAINEMRKNK